MTHESRATASCVQDGRVLALLHLCVLFPGVALNAGLGWAGGAAEAPEYAIKAAYICNFAKFVEWPGPDEAGLLRICVYGKTPLTGFLDEAARGQSAHGVPIEIRRIAEGEGEEQWEGCKVLFVGSGGGSRVQEMLARFRGRPTLTVGESDAFRQGGGMITLVVERDHVRFDIDLAPALEARLKLSSKLLRLGRVVKVAK